MQLPLPAQSKNHEDYLKEITNIILEIGREKIAFVILFGSFAYGNWVKYRYKENNTTYEYSSNYDLLIITKNGKLKNFVNFFDLERKINKQIANSFFLKEAHPCHIVIESISRINKAIKSSQPFFVKIRNEGIILYDSQEIELIANDKSFNNSTKDWLIKNYQHWFKSGKNFLIDYKNAVKRNDYKKAAFYLHQATESFYNCTLSSLGKYKPRSHNLEELNSLCSSYSSEFLAIFPKEKLEERQSFDLLQSAYIDSRYDCSYQINKSQLEYLFSEVMILKNLVKKLCEGYLSVKF